MRKKKLLLGEMIIYKPKITAEVIEGILAATSVILAGDVASAFGHEDAETLKDWEAVVAADKWAREMRTWQDAGKYEERKTS